jgi:hypothetical protein
MLKTFKYSRVDYFTVIFRSILFIYNNLAFCEFNNNNVFNMHFLKIYKDASLKFDVGFRFFLAKFFSCVFFNMRSFKFLDSFIFFFYTNNLKNFFNFISSLNFSNFFNLFAFSVNLYFFNFYFLKDFVILKFFNNFSNNFLFLYNLLLKNLITKILFIFSFYNSNFL